MRDLPTIFFRAATKGFRRLERLTPVKPKFRPTIEVMNDNAFSLLQGQALSIRSAVAGARVLSLLVLLITPHPIGAVRSSAI